MLSNLFLLSHRQQLKVVLLCLCTVFKGCEMGLNFKQSVAVERSELLVRLVVDAQCSDEDKEIAIAWIADTLGALKRKNVTLVNPLLDSEIVN